MHKTSLADIFRSLLLASHGYLGCLGIGMPFAIGSEVANPDKRVVCIVGDGAVDLNIQEFDTMVRHDLPVVTIVLNNKAWGICVHGQQAMYGSNRLLVILSGKAVTKKSLKDSAASVSTSIPRRNTGPGEIFIALPPWAGQLLQEMLTNFS